MRKIGFGFICLFIFSILNAQNNIWSLPPNYYKIGGVLPLPTPGAPGGLGTPGYDYDGSAAQYCHNAMQDAHGNLLFFIVDNAIYDKDGYLIDIFELSNNLTPHPTAEISIVPNPANCKQFYIFFASNIYEGNVFSLPYYAILDLSLPNINNPGRQGALIRSVNNPLLSVYNMAQEFNLTYNSSPRFEFAVTKLRNDNSRLIFMNNQYEFWIFKLDNNGLSLFNSYPYILSSYDPSLVGNTIKRSELEVIELLNGNYRVATSVFVSSSNVVSTGPGVCFFDLDMNANLISGSEHVVTYHPTSVPYPDVQGIEFSPNGDYIYVTHNVTPQFPVATEYIDVNTATSTPLNLVNNTDFDKSMIELGIDGALYMASSNHLARLANPNNPQNISWVDNFRNITYSISSDKVDISPSPPTTSFTLPDQIDGMDYSAYATANTECCIFYSASSFDVQDYTANSGTQTWQPGQNPFNNTTQPVTVYDNMVIPAGATITIKNMTFEFAPDAYVQIEKGGKLILDNSTFTVYQDCGNDVLWQGVYVAGTPNAFQGYTANRGWLQLQNNSVIERAHTAAHNYARTTSGGIDWSQVGGVIQSTNSSFKNNIRDVEFLAFSNLHPTTGVRINDLSRFTKTNFTTDNTLASINKWPGYHLTMWNVKGIVFAGCTFENTALSSYNTGQQGSGIYSIDAVYTVTRKCNTLFNCSNATNSAFNNLYYGIRSFAGTNGYTVNINHTGFDNNWRAIYLRGMQYPQVVENTFDVGENRYNSVSPPNVSYGLYLHNSTGYKVENNLLNTTHNGYMGIYVNNSGTGPNKIYRNEFYNLTVGTQTDKTNGDYSSAVSQQGLEYQCNNFYDIKDYDIYISNGSIKNQQGLCGSSITSPANNLFSYTAQVGDYYVDNAVSTYSNYNYSDNAVYNLDPRIGYFNNSKSSINDCSLSPANTPAYDPALSCPNKIPSGGIININLRKAEFAQYKQQIDSLQNIIDGGNTQALLNLINDANVPAWQKRNQLLAVSPYLSDKVMQELITSFPVTPSWVIQQVLAQNAPLSTPVLETLINHNTPLPDYIVRNALVSSTPLQNEVIETLLLTTNSYAPWVVEQVLQQNAPLSNENLKIFIKKDYPAYVVRNILSQNSPLSADVYDVLVNHVPGYPRWVILNVSELSEIEEHYVYQTPNLSPRMELDLEIAYLQSEMYFAKADIIRACLFDTTNVLTEKDAIGFLEQQSCKKDQCSLTGLCISAKDYIKAGQYIDSLATDTIMQELANYYSTVINVKQQNTKEEAAVKTDSTINSAFNTFAAKNGQESVLAASVLEFFSDTTIVEDVFITTSNANARTYGTSEDEDNSGIMEITDNTFEQNVRKNAIIYPNPASNILYVELTEVLANSSVSISDVTRKVLIQEQLTETISKMDISSLPNGIYFVSVKQNQTIIKTQKLIIVK